MEPMEAQRTRDALRAVRRIATTAQRLVDGRLDALYRAAFRRVGAGDSVLLIVDLGATGYYGSTRAGKRVLAAQAAAVLALAALRRGDRVGALLFTDRTELHLPPRQGRTQVLRIIREILFRDPVGRGSDLCGALDHASRLLRRRATAFVVSDFLLPGQISEEFARLEGRLRAAGQRHEVVVVSVSDPRELELPDLGVVTLENVETGERIEIDTSGDAARENYRRQAERYRGLVSRCLRASGVDRVQLTTADKNLVALASLLQRRGARRAS